jgi:hypothetical protein
MVSCQPSRTSCTIRSIGSTERKEAAILTMRQANRLREWMNQRGINRCVACGAEDDWNFSGGEVFVPPETSEERMSIRFQPSVPRGLKVSLPCKSCGYVMLFDAATVGVTRFY